MAFDLDNFYRTNALAQYPPKAGLETWHAADQHELKSDLTLYDLSGNGRDIVSDPDLPAIDTEAAINDQSVVEFDGTNTPLSSASASFSVKHIWVVASFSPATFSANLEGLISGLSSGGILVGAGAASTNFYDLGYGAAYDYRKNEILYADNAQSAPVNGAWAIMELQHSTGISVDGIQVGQDRGNATRKWIGSFAEAITYSRILSTLERERLYYYFALKYHLWRYSGSLPVFPFPADRQRSEERGKEVYYSDPYDGDPKALIRGGFRRRFSLPFSVRPQAEFEAAEAFHAARYPDPAETFIIRDYRYNPAKEREVRFMSPLAEQGSDVSFRFNYSFEVSEP